MLVAGLLVAAPLAFAQGEPDDDEVLVTFDHKGNGNQWWVEVYVDPRVDAVQARDTNGGWVGLNFRPEWGSWAGSFRIEPGNLVQFRAFLDDEVAESCWFTHPAGLAPNGGQTCSDRVAAGDDDDDGEGLQVLFDHKTGNSHWVEARVSPAVDTMMVREFQGGNDWVRMTFQPQWNSWAASFPIDEDRVQFRATLDGETFTSCWFTHPEGLAPNGGQTCLSDGEDDDGGDGDGEAVTFDHKTGNSHWVEVRVSPGVDAVQARDTNGPWVNMQFRPDFGNAWAASFPIEAGNQVQFRAVEDGEVAVSCWFTHPGGLAPNGGQTCTAELGDA